MCGRFGSTLTSAELAALYNAEWRGEEPPDLPRYNVAPTEDAPILRLRDGERVLDMFRWGLIPSWAKDPRIGSRMINARAETVVEKPAYRNALQRRRCLVPAGGFYEWETTASGKVPHWLHPADGGVMTFAGLWEFWRDGQEGPPVLSFTILTTTPSRDVSGLHDRMPVIVHDRDQDTWLDPETPPVDLVELLRPAPDGFLTSHEVSRAVNKAGNEGAELIEPV
ncbi:MAG TPA: SOS response-associated peptidase [Longimicrobiaceae bacterium]|nr:SOS response-associated peptidase [Longimicrobiaceae bacterium]